MYDKDNFSNIYHTIDPEQKTGFWGKFFKRLIKTTAYFSIFCLVLFGAFYARGRFAGQNGSDNLSWLNRIPIIGQIKTVAEGSSQPLKGEERGRVNILLLGIGGKGHDGGELTDTIMVLSVDTINKQAALLSIPRDLDIPIENIGWQKINHVNAYAEGRQPGSGGLAASQAVGNILDTTIDYYVKVDFDGFKDIIDQLGGVEVCVLRTFDDYTYPIEGQEDNPDLGGRWEHLRVEQGCQNMDSSLALKYARSRHAYGPEGTDFARAARQQKVMEAIKAKLLSKSTLLNPSVVGNIVENLNDHVSTNFKVWEMVKLWSLVKNIDTSKIATKVLSNSPDGLLVDAKGSDGAYLLLPRTGNFSEIQYLFKNIFNQASAEDKAVVQSENASVQILNGTWINGLASKMSVDLEKLGFKITGLANASRQDFETTVIYDLTFGQKKEALKLLKEKLKANVSFTLPDWLKADLARNLKDKAQPDLVIILGQNASHTEE